MKYSLNFIRTITCISLLFFGYFLQAQLVNIESKRMHTDSIRFVLNSDLLFNYTDNNGAYILQIGSNLSTQLKSKNLKSIYFLIGNVNLIRSKNEDFQNSYFMHARFNQKLSDVVRLEAFAQNQNNKKLTITERSLLGIGFRFKLLATNRTRVYFGNSYMYEIETIELTDQKFYNHRNSSYVSLNQAFKRYNLDITGTLYFQPQYNNIGNHRILSQFKAEVPLTKTISFSALYNYSVINFNSSLEDDRSSNISFGFTLNI
ncbi:DUF481 domain-containing protein [Maribacter sp. ACAM166]|uniref:DUF481 domain-containing protein n=1 Tax=Maribacter sp. ACAM166 TaxID=2508996 RepID=UPI0010FDBD9D|nr:DUF481 domain-containing protein [Maribacter sp. ACAM166]TLP80171.1 DUF481 domain-containing protein [Maribacter sp. ACAM166]